MFRVRNWQKFQHYKDRNPPWIKLHYEIMTSADWVMLADASKLLAIVCMMIASRNNGMIPSDPSYIKRVAYLDKLPDFMPLIKSGFLEKVLADDSGCKHLQADARPETETETEEDISKEKNNTKKEKFGKPESVGDATWHDFLILRKAKKAPVTSTAIARIEREANKIGWSLEQALSTMCARGWQGFDAEWAKKLEVESPRELSASPAITEKQAEWYRKHAPLSPVLAEYERTKKEASK